MDSHNKIRHGFSPAIIALGHIFKFDVFGQALGPDRPIFGLRGTSGGVPNYFVAKRLAWLADSRRWSAASQSSGSGCGCRKIDSGLVEDVRCDPLGCLRDQAGRCVPRDEYVELHDSDACSQSRKIVAGRRHFWWRRAKPRRIGHQWNAEILPKIRRIRGGSLPANRLEFGGSEENYL